MSKRLTNILVKPVGSDCNIDCRYCFYLDRPGRDKGGTPGRMSNQVLVRMLESFLAQDESQLSITWQGGEPTLRGLDFYQRAVQLMQQYGRGQSLGNGFQTNGLNINTRWADFFARYHFLVGLSLDGDQHTHDHYRQHIGGLGTWSRVVAAAQLLIDHGVMVNALSVVTDYSARYASETYRFLRDLALVHIQFIPCYETDSSGKGGVLSFSVSPEAYGDFLCQVYDLWRADFVAGLPTTSVRFFESVLHTYAGLPAPECSLSAECGSYLVVEHTGDLYSCDFFVGAAWHLGNVLHDDLAAVLNSVQQRTFGCLKNSLPDTCTKCQWLSVCSGGCTKDRYRNEHGEMVPYFCHAFKKFFAHADADLKNLAAQSRASRTGKLETS